MGFKKFATKDLNIKSVYHLLISGVSPRPIALVGSMDNKGFSNLAPFSFFNAFGNPVLPLNAGEKPIIGGLAPKALKNEKGARLEKPLLSIDPTKAIGRGETPEISRW
jgi:hypothetical protein